MDRGVEFDTVEALYTYIYVYTVYMDGFHLQDTVIYPTFLYLQ